MATGAPGWVVLAATVTHLLTAVIYTERSVYTSEMAKHLVDIDEDTLTAAHAELGTTTMKDTVNEALRRACAQRSARVDTALDRLAQRRLPPREKAWR
jgi:Arc/MetJ family transcription regulator